MRSITDVLGHESIRVAVPRPADREDGCRLGSTRAEKEGARWSLLLIVPRSRGGFLVDLVSSASFKNFGFSLFVP